MTKEINERIYKYIVDHCTILELSDNLKISKLAFEEMITGYLEIIYKFDGIGFLKEKLKNENNQCVTNFIAGMFLTIDKDYVEKFIDDPKDLLSGICFKDVLGEVNGSFEEKAVVSRKLQIEVNQKKKMNLNLPF